MRQQSRLRNQIHGLIILHFHICNLLRNLYQPTKYHIICFLSYLKVSPHLWWYNSRALFLSKWSRTQACPPFNMHWLRCTDSLRKFYRCSQKLTDCYRHYPKNIIIRYKDRHIMEKNMFGDLTYSSGFQYMYYHLSRDHAVRKNPIFQNNPIVCASPEDFTHFNNDLELNPWYVRLA